MKIKRSCQGCFSEFATKVGYIYSVFGKLRKYDDDDDDDDDTVNVSPFRGF